MSPRLQPARRHRLVETCPGATRFAHQLENHSIKTTSFIKNAAFDYGGAISIVNPVRLNISDVTFAFNEADSGGAVVLTSTVRTTANFLRCRFEYNEATSGGGLYLSGEGQRFLRGSVFRSNVAGEASSGAKCLFRLLAEPMRW